MCRPAEFMYVLFAMSKCLLFINQIIYSNLSVDPGSEKKLADMGFHC